MMLKTFKATLKGLIRREAEVSREHEPFQVHARPLGERPGLNYDNISELLEQVEGPFHK